MGNIAGRVCVVLASILSLAVVIEAGAEEMYKYTDKDGTPSYTDDIQLVPTEYRKRAVKIYNRPENPAKKQDERVAAFPAAEPRRDGTPAGAEAKKDWWSFLTGGRVLGLAAAVGAFMLALYIIGRIASSLGHQQAGMLVKVVLTFLGLLYVFGTYAGEMTETYKALKEEIVDIKAKKAKHDAQVTRTIEESVPSPQR